jgi:2-dehydro-3-deoxyphosphogluconate aldolase/(4S)-4-hydroxy-2-oxoglutarate aldolase
MRKNDILKRLEMEKLIAVVRMAEDIDTVFDTCEALVKGGITIIEITADTPDARELIRGLVGKKGRSYLVGAGTVLNAPIASAMIEEGAEFIVSPAVIEEVIRVSHRSGVAVFPGALTPTEIWRAHSRGADAVKVFPASLLGPSYLRLLSGPFPGYRLIPTGGVNADNVADFIRAGAFAVGVGSDLINRDAAKRGDWEQMASRAAQFVRVVKEALNASAKEDGNG